jgi:hypothetical protein
LWAAKAAADARNGTFRNSPKWLSFPTMPHPNPQSDATRTFAGKIVPAQPGRIRKPNRALEVIWQQVDAPDRVRLIRQVVEFILKDPQDSPTAAPFDRSGSARHDEIVPVENAKSQPSEPCKPPTAG